MTDEQIKQLAEEHGIGWTPEPGAMLYGEDATNMLFQGIREDADMLPKLRQFVTAVELAERERWQAAVRTVLADWTAWDEVTAHEIQRLALKA